MGKLTTTGVALLAVLAVTAVLVSPMPDELPGTTVKHGVLALMVAVHDPSSLWDVPASLGPAFLPAGSHLSLDLLAVTCARLC